jgi:hypothetical protein
VTQGRQQKVDQKTMVNALTTFFFLAADHNKIDDKQRMMYTTMTILFD